MSIKGKHGQTIFNIFESLRDEYLVPAPRLYANCAGRAQGWLFGVEDYGSWGCGVKDAGLLCPTKADWGPTWPSLALSWAEHEPTWAQLGCNLRRTRATWLQLGSNFRWLGSNMAQLGHVWTLFSACRIESAKLTRVGPKLRYVGPSPKWSCTTERLAHSMASVAKLSRLETCDAGGCTVVHCCHCGGQCCDVPP